MIVKTTITESFKQVIDKYTMITTHRNKVISIDIPDTETGEMVSKQMTKQQYLKSQGFSERAELLCVEGVRAGTPKQMRKDFERQAKTNNRVAKPCIHTKISFDKKERIINDQLIDLSQQWLKAMEWANTQYAIIRHHDGEKHDHVHLIANVVGYDEKLKTGWYKNKSTRMAMKIEKENGLIIAAKQVDQRRASLKKMIMDGIQKGMEKEALYQYVKQQTGFEAIENKASTGRVSGLSWELKRKRIKYKASYVDKNLSYSKIMKALDRNRKKGLNTGRGLSI